MITEGLFSEIRLDYRRGAKPNVNAPAYTTSRLRPANQLHFLPHTTQERPRDFG